MHHVCHIEWDVTDLGRAQKFYGAIFDWTFAEFGGEMVVFSNGGEHIGGLMRVDRVQPGSSPSVWIQVASVDETALRAQAAGGTLLKPKSPVPGVGWSAVVGDHDGNPVGVVEFER